MKSVCEQSWWASRKMHNLYLPNGLRYWKWEKNISYSIFSQQTLIIHVTFKFLLKDLEFLSSTSSKIKLKPQTIMIYSFTLKQSLFVLFSRVAWKRRVGRISHSYYLIISDSQLFFFFFSRLGFPTIKKAVKGRQDLFGSPQSPLANVQDYLSSA